MSAGKQFVNAAAAGVPYFTPAQIPASGTALDPQPDGKPIPKLFQPLRIRGLEFHNRIWLSPLCQYSAKGGKPTAWHMAHLGGIILRGPGLSFLEATAVTPEGRITPEDLGIWSDDHISHFADIATFAHSQNQKVGIQLAHAGRKASTVAPWLSFSATATKELDGWPDDVWAPSAIPHSDGFPQPHELTKERIERIKQGFVDAAKRALKAGIDVIEIHGAHGYLLHEFVSPISNHRTDEYGGSFENRTRLSIEIVDAVRAVIPKDTPLFYRISASDRLEDVFPNEPSWTVDDSVKFAEILADHGVDLLDVSSAGNHPKQHLPPKDKAAFHADLSQHIKAAVGDKIIVGTVGGISDGKTAQKVLDDNQADVIFVGRHFQKNPGTVWEFAEDLSVGIVVAHQIEWAFFGRGVGRPTDKKST
ncbi:hypothetical protein PHLCEN_2v6614 [Hermanssonia centrifuga]|uniref:NADH:flavin oxidoreductase/NADH oxidase N-terminal domain-containing protein n=1 Tax=Hermanssonia centrifuga TaxID=98765 RepID=A0A2R6NYR0_9APHY|nr:hypothetical protein PHLCEN_2v6614 [Hermanssonia centrifuga]